MGRENSSSSVRPSERAVEELRERWERWHASGLVSLSSHLAVSDDVAFRMDIYLNAASPLASKHTRRLSRESAGYLKYDVPSHIRPNDPSLAGRTVLGPDDAPVAKYFSVQGRCRAIEPVFAPEAEKP